MNRDRMSHGWSVGDLAEAAGVSTATASRFLTGENQAPWTAKKLAIALGYPVSRYLRDTETVAR